MTAGRKEIQESNRLEKILKKMGCRFEQATRKNGYKVFAPRWKEFDLDFYTWHKNDQHLHNFIKHIITEWNRVIDLDRINLPCMNKKMKMIKKYTN